MKLTNGSDVVELSSQGHIDAFKQAGWTEYTEPKKAEKPKKSKE